VRAAHITRMESVRIGWGLMARIDPLKRSTTLALFIQRAEHRDTQAIHGKLNARRADRHRRLQRLQEKRG
jgi:hypothetical protein